MKWINICDALPPKDGNYLCVVEIFNGHSYMEFLEYKDSTFFDYYDDGDFIDLTSSVLYWIELPEIPGSRND